MAAQRTGTIGLSLTVAPGITIDSVSYAVTGSGMSPITGTLPAGDGTGNTFVALLNGIPAGPARHVDLLANASNGTVCKGDATVDVLVGQISQVSVTLDCRGDAGGAILVNGKLDQCPRIKSIMAAPATAPVGSAISVAAAATDVDDSISVVWTATSGSFEDPVAPATHFKCGTAGKVHVTATVTDASGCSTAASVDVTCTPAGACGNGIIDPPEQCDGTHLNGETCATATMNALPNGTLACGSTCTFDTSGCTAPAEAGAGGSGGMVGAGGAGGSGGTM